MQNDRKFASCLADIGLDLVSYGADVKRVEDTISRMSKAYGAKNSHILAISSSIFLTLVTEDGVEHTRTRRVSTTDNDFIKLEMLNELSREYCSKKLSVDELEKRIIEIKELRYSKLKSYIGHAVGAGSFAIFFGGNLYDGFAGLLAGLFVCAFRAGEKYIPLKSSIIYRLILAFMAGTFIQLMALFLPIHTEMVKIGTIMLLIPGIALTNSIRDIVGGDTITGMLRFIESITIAAALGLGFMFSVVLFR